MKFRISILVAVLLFVFAGCGPSFEKLNQSDNGNLIEKLLPKDAWFVLSVTTKDVGQRAEFEDFVNEFSSTEDFFAKVQEGFSGIGVDYENDIKPIIGQDGFRMVMAYAGTDNFVAMTVADSAKAQEWLDLTVERGEASLLALADFDVYVSQTEGGESYTALLDDILVVANSSTALMNAEGRLSAWDSESLLDNEDYMKGVSEIKSPYLGYVYVDVAGYQQVSGGSLGLLSFGNALLNNEVIGFSFDDGAVLLSGYGAGDKDAISEYGISIADISGEDVYLTSYIPSEEVAFYEEAGGFANMVDLFAMKSGDAEGFYETLDTNVTKYLGMDLKEDLLTFLDKGYAIAIHRGEGSLPYFSLVVDASSNPDGADDLVDRIDAQISSLVNLVMYDQSGTFSSLTKNTAEVMGGDFNVVSLDTTTLGQMMTAYSGSGTSATSSLNGTMSLFYGVTEDDILIISTYPDWEVFEEDDALSENDTFVSAMKNIKGYDNTIFYLDLSVVADYLGLVRTAESVLVGSGTVSSGAGQIVEYLDSLSSAVFGVKAGDESVEMRGRVE